MSIANRIVKNVTLTGVTPIIFDRYAGDNKTQLSPDQKMYFIPKTKTMCLPAPNLLSFFSSTNTESAPKMLLDKRDYRRICSALAASLTFDPFYIPFLRDGKPIEFHGFTEEENQYDPVSGVRVVYHVARLKDGIPNPKIRPQLDLPWQLKFKLSILPHRDLTIEMIENLLVDGGALIGVGTYRKVFGKFDSDWA